MIKAYLFDFIGTRGSGDFIVVAGDFHTVSNISHSTSRMFPKFRLRDRTLSLRWKTSEMCMPAYTLRSWNKFHFLLTRYNPNFQTIQEKCFWNSPVSSRRTCLLSFNVFMRLLTIFLEKVKTYCENEKSKLSARELLFPLSVDWVQTPNSMVLSFNSHSNPILVCSIFIGIPRQRGKVKFKNRFMLWWSLDRFSILLILLPY